ncbi:MAG TPA: YceI family protein [Alphaproteobacteria bacterium]|nr:YceI family protein [Alphaproteobacteria bacterium]HOO50453.1 YceI family protein [Alphaproteobacteria bacterium]
MKAVYGVIAFFFFSLPTISFADEPFWLVDKEQSVIAFSAEYEGDQFSGNVSEYEIVVRFDPEDLKSAAAAVSFDMTSVLTGNEMYDSPLSGEEWLNTIKFPNADFTSTSFDDLNANTGLYTLHGTFTLLGVTKDLAIPFSFASQDDETAVIDGSFQLKRSDFGLGTQSTDSKDVSEIINVTFHLIASL